ncbi:fumarylacetoacetate hydrolase family protein [Canibacter zhoujuaniae]|uniref:fumarylacetoacetate hydrolase family protein n=1 Tax=Canibacter zhoujuaniae TaxID=2708343 RepID=UPI00141D95E1|nr:fumarylacetoacetate hydrolase family protein [Canibacter zhoujuaniae]
MKFAHIKNSSTSVLELAVVSGDRAIPVSLLGQSARTLQELINQGATALDLLREALSSAGPEAGVSLDSVTWGPAVIAPPVTLAVGLNYDEHASELSLDNDSGPVLFSLFPNSLGAHEATVELPTAVTREVDYEGELGVIIGKPAKNVKLEEALDYVFGYTVVNDMTARNLQFQEPQWSRCKSFDGFSPVGPVVVTADEIPDPQNLAITTDFDGLRVQDSNTRFMIRSVAQLIVSLSQATTLQPGTLISTGSPGGAGRSRKPPLYFKEGTECTVTIEGIGALTTRTVEI